MYYHKVLEAKIVLSDHVIVSPGTGFIENETEIVSKQDCKINAAKRLDALYAAEPVMRLCREKYHWEYLLTQKDTRQMDFIIQSPLI